MQRIKLEVFKKFFEKNLTGNEIDFLIALTYVQDNRGIARGVFYRDMMAVTGPPRHSMTVNVPWKKKG